MMDLASARVLLINIADNRSKRIYKEYPLGLGYIGTSLYDLNAIVKIFDMSVDQSDLMKLTKEFKPDIIGLSFLSPAWPITQKTIKDLRNFYNGWIISGGIHSSLFAENVIKAGVDVVVMGEGDHSILRLVSNLHHGSHDAYKNTPGIAYISNGKLHVNEPAPTISDLDELPFINRELYHNLALYSHHSLLTSRGCPYACKFCCNWGSGVQSCRARSPRNVVDEIEYLHRKYQATLIYFADDIFFFNNTQRLKFCDILSSRNLNISWVVQLRPDCINEPLLEAMKKAGCIKICLGLESGSQYILDKSAKKISVDMIRNALFLTKKVGIPTKTWWIIGLPGDYNEQLKSLNLMIETKPNEISIHTLIPLPGSEYWENSKKYGIQISDNVNLGDFYYHSIPESITYDYLSQEDIKKLISLFSSELKKVGYKTTGSATTGDQFILSTPFETVGFDI